MSINKVFLRGRVGKNPEQFSSVTKFSIATSENFKDQSGEWQERTEWHNIIAFGKTGENIMRKVRKGDLIAIDEGKLQTRKFEKNGQEHYATSIVVNRFEILTKHDKPKDELDQALDTYEGGEPGFDPDEMIPF